MKINIKKYVLSVLLSFVLSILFLMARNAVLTTKIVIDQDCSQPAIAQIFFDTGNGYNETDSVIKNFAEGKHSKAFYFYSINKIKSIRYDPSRISDECKIYKIEFLSSANIGKNFDLSSIHKIINASSKIKDGVLIIKAENNDPILDLGNIDQYTHHEKLFTYYDFLIPFKVGFWVILLLTIADITTGLFSKSRVKHLIAKYSRDYPVRSVFLVSLLSILISNYPVIFFNKSFVSPIGISTITNNGTWMKGFAWDGKYEGFRGSDLGAMMWEIKPNSVVAGNTIFKDHEFPFYNRYVGAGVPLYGQANNLTLDPLNFIPLLFKNFELGWDIKFLISRLLFTFGIGVLLLKLNFSNVKSVLLITFASAFLGYFAYRFNHPAVFCLTYSPWILICWISLSSSVDDLNTAIGQKILFLLLLLFLSWFMINGGPIKETVIFTVYIQFLGGALFLTRRVHDTVNVRVVRLLVIYASLALIFTPYLLVFLDTLRESYTLYDNPTVTQLTWGHLLGFFDNSFSPELLIVSTNLFFLFCMVSYFIGVKDYDVVRKIFFYPALFCLLVVYGILPAAFLIKVPFIKNIHHIYNVFSIPILFSTIVLSSLGLKEFIERDISYQRKIFFSFIKIYFLLFILAVIYFFSDIKPHLFMLFLWHLLLFWLFYVFALRVAERWLSINTIFILMGLMILPEGQHLMTGVNVIDKNIINPMPRGNESYLPNYINFLKEKLDKNPTRVIGESETFFPGFNAQLEIEGVVTVDPLRNKNFEHLLDVLEYPDEGWGWLRLVKQNQFDKLIHGLNMLGVGYVVANKDIKVPETLNLVYKGDLAILENPTVWPRAFYSDNLKLYSDDRELKEIISKETKPFVAVSQKDWMSLNGFEKHSDLSGGKFQAAYGYKLSGNATVFNIFVPAPGFVVVLNSFYPDDFVIEANGRRLNYFRVNEAFIGIRIEAPGEYKVSVRYRPKSFGLYLVLMLIGLLVSLISIIKFKK